MLVDTDPFARLPAGRDELRALYEGIFAADVDAATLELCRLRLATLVGSRDERQVCDPRARAAGLEDHTIAALPQWPTSPRFSAAQRAALGFTEQFAIDPHGFADADAGVLLQHFTPAQLATLTVAVATFDALARVRAILT